MTDSDDFSRALSALGIKAVWTPGQVHPSIAVRASAAKPLTAGFISRENRARNALASKVASPARSARPGIFTTISASR